MASGKTKGDAQKDEPERQPETKPEPLKDELAELIERYSEEVEPVPPPDDAGQPPDEGK